MNNRISETSKHLYRFNAMYQKFTQKKKNCLRFVLMGKYDFKIEFYACCLQLYLLMPLYLNLSANIS